MTAPSSRTTDSTQQEVVITRLFDAPRDLVFEALTDPKHVQQWWSPHGFTNPRVEIDLRPGGMMLVDMRGPDGQIYPDKSIFHEIVPPERLVFTSTAFEDENGEAQLQVHHTITFDEQDGKTMLTLRARVLKASPEVMEALAGMEQGWSESFDKLEAVLKGVQWVNSRDRTPIAYDRYGDGPPVIMVAGALGTRSHADWNRAAQALAPRFTVITYDRRGRGDSLDLTPYEVQREVEDIEALIDAFGGSAYLYGISSGAVLALEAASRLPDKVIKLAMYEPPFITDDSRPPVPADYIARLQEFIAQGRRGDAVALFMTDAVGIPAEFVEQMRSAPVSEVFAGEEGMVPPEWAELEAVAHTLVYDAMIMGDTMSGKPLDAAKWSTATMPTLVITGGNSAPFFATGARALVAQLPNARHFVLEGQDHNVAPDALAPVLTEFFAG